MTPSSENSSKPSAASDTSLTTLANPSRRWSLAARLTAWYTGSAFVLILGTTCFLYWAVVTTLEREDDQYLSDKARVLIAILNEQGQNIRELRNEVERESGPRPAGQIFVRLLNSKGQTIAETHGMNDSLPSSSFPEPGDADSPAGHICEINSLSGSSFRALALRAPQGGIVQVAMDRTAEEDLLGSYRWYAATILSVGLLVCGLAGYALARHGLAPLRSITSAAQQIRSSTLHQRLDSTDLPSEMATLADTFNDMLGRLEESFRRLERFSADIAHELRTPVNNMRGEAEVSLSQPRTTDQYRNVLESSLEECGRLTSLIDSLLFLARAESPQAQINRQALDIGRELTTVREFYQAAAEDGGIELNIDVPQQVVSSLDRTLFQRAVSNLVANALVHTPNGGTITLRATQDDALVCVEVSDSGSGIPPEHLPFVFDRFYRADAARSSGTGSVGLGLSLVKSIVALHHGTCTIQSEPKNGTLVRLQFPLSKSENGSQL